MLKHTLPLVLVLTACGESTSEAPASAEIAAKSTGAATDYSPEQGGVKLLQRGAELPKCQELIEGLTYYVVEQDEFQACSSSQWVKIDLRGKAGKEGLAGKDGLEGAKGEKGDKGDKGERGDDGAQGIAGQNGLDGQDGVDGQNGLDGADGQDAQTLRLVSGATYIGDVYSLDKTTNDFWTVRGDMRMEIDRTEGTFPYAYLVFSGANCTGTSRLVLTNGYFANVYVRGDSGAIVKATGANLGSFTYASRLAQTTNCANTSGSSNLSWAYSNPTLGFTYPVVAPEIEN